METTRYPDSNSYNPFVWYDVPGAGTQNTPDWVYFVEQGLYIFDSIVVVYGDRFTEIDIAILKNCDRWRIPAYVVRSKAGQNIQNVMNELVESESDDEDEDTIKDTRKDVHDNLEQAGLPQQRVYIVDQDILVPVVNGKTHPDTIDEADLYRDLLAEASRRRIVAD
ncbi:uncharacterized protein B0H18DRAFT_938339 [Fomitopsis serialis]|uniref:uncharacterized protein n=1 Tax=Fomitopsis serialis TaxID=139415 RepID=UPI002008D50C|nr:uncharacterized protein B0H18DRAFT_938339 [Neoantrodia serialis]KAH9917598.1 hypothetical protein B0H18DRAFT_938339 [Neoantrodia serialis]